MSIYPRTNYEMTEEDYKELLEACKPTPCISFDGISNAFDSPQQNANRVWQKLGEKMGFEWDSVQPSTKGNRFFTAIPSETEAQRIERLSKEAEDKRQNRIAEIKKEMEKFQIELKELENKK